MRKVLELPPNLGLLGREKGKNLVMEQPTNLPHPFFLRLPRTPRRSRAAILY
uniref:Uncharacterized protein n=1 Tax=Rhizophora mucronata TaxID=61149 RepID=A0A2P2MYG1_RHIMU